MTDPLISPVASLEARAQALGVADRLSLRNYVTETEIGAFQSERGVTQRLRFNVVVELREPTGNEADDVDQILSYDRLSEAIDGELAGDRLDLLETLADRIATRILREDQVLRVFLRIEKLDRGPGDLGVEIMREGSGRAADNSLPYADVILAGPGSEIPERGPLVICPNHNDVDVGDVATENARRRIQLLAAEQTAWRIAATHGIEVVASRTEMDWAIGKGKRVIWAPGKMILNAGGAAPVQVTGLSLVDWLRSQMRNASE